MNADLTRSGVKYRDVLETEIPKASPASARQGLGVAIPSNFPEFGVRSFPLVGPDGPVEFVVYASWRRDHYALEEIRGYVELFRDAFATRNRRAREASLKTRHRD
ncbi:hypothetical protein [Granulicoccus phenolivorans]|uniref:hypothetical protein n=1 Tax=Granulicoccus phenolivorans TaxID=266854 RepID=UPI000421D5D6|nr:hypothetical protein [Granulicoccus phenolivorans]